MHQSVLNSLLLKEAREQCDLSPGEECQWGPYWYNDNGFPREDPYRKKCKRCKTVEENW